MILARLTRAVREQNWFAVALEFVIVIAGVVIGFQITEWRGEQADRRLEGYYLERLHADLVGRWTITIPTPCGTTRSWRPKRSR